MEGLKELVDLSFGESLFMKWNCVWWPSGVNCRDSMQNQKDAWRERKEGRGGK